MTMVGKSKLVAAIFSVVVSSGIAGPAIGKDLEFKGFVFGRTTFSEWQAAMHKTATDFLGSTVTIAPYCEEQGKYVDQAEVAVGVKRCSSFTPSAGDTNVGVAGTMLQVGDAVANTDEWVFVDGVLAQYNATLYHAQLGNLLPPLRAKYGNPTEHSDQVQNAFGAKYVNTVYEWQLDGMNIVVRGYQGRLDQSGITIFNPLLQNKLETKEKQKPVSKSGL